MSHNNNNTTTRHVYIFALQGQLLDDLRREVTSTLAATTQDHKPKVLVHDARYGVAKIELLDFRESAALLPFWSFQIEISNVTSSRIVFADNREDENSSHADEEKQRVQHNSIESDHSTDDDDAGDDANKKTYEFDVDSLELDGVIIDDTHRLINMSNHDRNARFYLRLPVFLKPYTIDIRVRCKFISSMAWSEWADLKQIEVCSSTLCKDFKVNDAVRFSPLYSNHAISGRIHQVIDSDKGLYQIRGDGYTQRKLYNDVHSSRIYQKGPRLKHIVIDMDDTKYCHINRMLLFPRCPGQSMLEQIDFDVTLYCVSVMFKAYAIELCQGFASISSTDYPFIGQYFANRIMQFLYGAESSVHEGADQQSETSSSSSSSNSRGIHALKCVLNEQHGLMQLGPIWHSCLLNQMELMRCYNHGRKPSNLGESSMEFSCDLCGVEMSCYEYMFQCNGGRNVLDMHFICILCGHNVIQQYNQVEEVLSEWLQPYLYYDLIKLIAELVCGSVVFI